jgi:hypothetical protein
MLLSTCRFVACLGGLVLAVSVQPARPAGDASPATVKLVIDFGDGAQKAYSGLPWTEGMTVLDALTAAQAAPHGIRFEYSGTGATAFVTRIDDMANQGGGAGKKNWVYRVNGQYAKQSSGACKLRAGDKVVWFFSVFPPR